MLGGRSPTLPDEQRPRVVGIDFAACQHHTKLLAWVRAGALQISPIPSVMLTRNPGTNPCKKLSMMLASSEVNTKQHEAFVHQEALVSDHQAYGEAQLKHH